jgi:uroporphyrinogen decarboxylase
MPNPESAKAMPSVRTQPSASLPYRERFSLTLAHQAVDRPPMDLGATDMTVMEGGPRRLAPLLGLPTRGAPAELDEAVLQALDIDIRDVGGILSPPSGLERQVSSGEYIDTWGIRYQHNGHHWEAVGRPLAGATLDDLERYPWPDPERIDPRQIAALREQARWLYEQTPYVVCARHPYFGVFELGCWMCGFDDFLYRLAGEPDFVQRFFEIILAYQMRVNEIYYAALGPYIHYTTSGDDFGTQTGPFLSVKMFDRLIKPFLARRIAHIRGFTAAAFFHHTCGAVRPLIPSLIDAGVQILNPIQPRAFEMEPERLKAEFGDRLSFYGGVDTQYILPNGSPAEVRAEVRRLIGILGAQGGYILSPAHVFQEDVPLENIAALYRAGLD